MKMVIKMHPLKIGVCALASAVWIATGVRMAVNPEKAEAKKSILVMWLMTASLLALLGGIWL
jgi:hypothetical protein